MSEKDAYRKKMQAQLDEWGAEIARLKAKADQADADARLEYQNQLENLRDRQDKARRQLDELTQAGDDAWRDLTAGLEKAWRDLGDAVSAATSRFK